MRWSLQKQIGTFYGIVIIGFQFMAKVWVLKRIVFERKTGFNHVKDCIGNMCSQMLSGKNCYTCVINRIICLMDYMIEICDSTHVIDTMITVNLSLFYVQSFTLKVTFYFSRKSLFSFIFRFKNCYLCGIIITLLLIHYYLAKNNHHLHMHVWTDLLCMIYFQ